MLRLAATAAALVLTGCASAGTPDPDRAALAALLSGDTRVEDLGPVRLTTHRGPGYFDSIVVVVRGPEDRALVQGLFRAVPPRSEGTLLGCPSLYTVEQYLESPDRAEDPAAEAERLQARRRKLEADLEGRFAAVYRYVSTDKKPRRSAGSAPELPGGCLFSPPLPSEIRRAAPSADPAR